MTTNYNEDQIQVLEGLEAVRKRPGMYIGSTSSRGLHHLVWEIVDNSIDEYLAGFCDTITVTIHKDNSISVQDDGRGIPVKKHKKMGIPTLEVVLTVLHAGGKFGGDNSGYKVSGGLHGVGSSCVNALSEKLVATVFRDEKKHEMTFSKGITQGKLKTEKDQKDQKTGTHIWFKPDPEIFTETLEYEFRIIHNRLRESAFLNPGLSITLIDERDRLDETDEFRTVHFNYEGGISDFVKHLNESKKVLHDDVFYVKEEQDGVLVEVALQYQDSYSKDGIFSYANNIKTIEGGTHETGFKSALTSSVKSYITGHNLMKGNDLPTGDDTRIGLTAIISVKVPDPQFEGQTKGKLGNSEVRPIVDSIVSHQLTRYFEENPKITDGIVSKIIDSFEERMAARKARQERRKKKQNDSSSFTDPDKLAPCSSNDRDKTEIYIVEGDSAGGSAKQGRDKVTQAILPLRGKIINTEKAKLKKIYENREIESIRFALGTDMAEDFDYEKLKYNKVIIMTDADVDGAHISILLLTYFYRYMKPLVEKGHIFMARPPLFKIQQGKKVRYAYSDKEKEKTLNELGTQPKPSLQRYKGLGEMNPTQLWETTMDPDTRSLFQVTLDDAAEAESLFTKLMGDDPLSRREFIQEHSHTANIDA